MGRRISDSDPSGKQPCAFCRTMRIVLIFAVMLVMLMAYADKLSWLRDIDFTTLFGYSMVVIPGLRSLFSSLSFFQRQKISFSLSCI